MYYFPEHVSFYEFAMPRLKWKKRFFKILESRYKLLSYYIILTYYKLSSDEFIRICLTFDYSNL